MRFEKDQAIPVEKDSEKSLASDHEEHQPIAWSTYLESARLEVELNNKKTELYSILLLAFTLGISISESFLLEALGERSSVNLLSRLAAEISILVDGLGDTFIFIALLIMRCVMGECFRQVGATYCYERTEKDSTDVNSLEFTNTAISRSKQCVLGMGVLALYSFKSDTSRLSASLMLSSIPHILNLGYRYASRIKQTSHTADNFYRLATLFPKKKLRLEQGGKIKGTNLFLLRYSREAIDEGLLMAYMKKNVPYLTIVEARVDEGLVFSVKEKADLKKMKPLSWGEIRLRPRSQVCLIEEGALEVNTTSGEEAREMISSAIEEKEKEMAWQRKSGKKKATARLHKAGARFVLDPTYDKKGAASQATRSEKNKRLPMRPEWLRIYDEACSAIIEVNTFESTSAARIFVYGSAMEDIRNQREIPFGSDIDLCILVLDTHRFKFPIDLKPLSRFPNEYNNVACDFKGLKIDITIKYSTTLNPNNMIRDLLAGNDFSHTRTVIPYNENFIYQISDHTQTCIDMRILSSYPRGAKEIFLENPYRIFRALSALFSGYSLVDEDMFNTLNDFEFCLRELSRLKPERIFWGFHKLFNRSHPVLILDQFKRMGFLDRYFKEACATYELTRARVHFVHSALTNSLFSKDMSFIYALLLWPAFSIDTFYQTRETHFFRVQAFFKMKMEDGILFPGRAKNPDVFVNPESEPPKGECADLQIKISLLFYGLSQDLKNSKELYDAKEFASLKADWIAQYQALFRSVLTKAFAVKLPSVDTAALCKEHLYSKPCPKDENVLVITGPAYSYF